jgi:hypothetical protein
MPRRGLLVAVAIVVLANLAAWGAAARNRSGEPEAVLVLTENELRLPVRETENTALALSLVFDRAPGRGQAAASEPGWFDRAKLVSIGFDCSRPLTAEHAAFYRTRPPRATYAALEYFPDAPPRSRLVPVDVGNDAAALRRRHPDRRRVAVVEATAVLRLVRTPGQPPFLMGYVTSVLPEEIQVPREWRGVLEGLQADARASSGPVPWREPRFRATIVWGRRLEPWITNVELLKPEPGR